MQIRQLEYLVALAREGHFARVAEACFVSQPSLSEAVHRLEEELGVQLVHRNRSYQGLTPEGEKVLVRARRILADYEALRQEAREGERGLEGRLSLACVPAGSVAGAVLADRFCTRHPGAELRMDSRMRSMDVVEAVRTFQVDGGLIYADQQPPGLALVPLYQEEQVLLVSEELAGAEKDPWKVLEGLPLCLMGEQMHGRELVDRLFAAHGLQAAPRITADTWAALVSLVGTGRWASVVARQWIPEAGLPPGLRCLGLGHGAEVALVHAGRSPGSPLVEAFVEVAQEVAREGLL